jgi:hypothetical protein
VGPENIAECEVKEMIYEDRSGRREVLRLSHPVYGEIADRLDIDASPVPALLRLAQAKLEQGVRDGRKEARDRATERKT